MSLAGCRYLTDGVNADCEVLNGPTKARIVAVCELFDMRHCGSARLVWSSGLSNHSVIWMTRMKTQSSRIVLAGVVLLLALMALLADGAARRESVTFDEMAHIGAGVSYLQKLDMRMNEEHPPLAKVLAAVPLVVRGVHADYSQVSWTFSGSGMFKQFLGEWVFGHWLITRWNDPIATVFWARQPMLFLTLVLGVVLFRLWLSPRRSSGADCSAFALTPPCLSCSRSALWS